MKEWSEKTLSPTSANALLNSRGEDRKTYLKEYLVMQLKNKGQMKRVETSEEHSFTALDTTKFYEWNSETMNQKMDPTRAAAVRALPADDPNALKWFPCPYTKKTKDPLRIWLCPIHEKRKTNANANVHKLKAEGEATEEDANTFASGSAGPSSGSSGYAGHGAVKEEIKTPEELLKIKVSALQENIQPEIRKLQDMQLSQESWASNCGEDPFKAPLVAAVGKNRPQLNRAIALMSKINKGEVKTDEDAMLATIELIEQIEQNHAQASVWAVNYGIISKVRSKKVRTT
jgi:hypothetical protein